MVLGCWSFGLKGSIKEEKVNLAIVAKKNPEKDTLDAFVNKYPSQVPHLLDVHRGKVDISYMQSLIGEISL